MMERYFEPAPSISSLPIKRRLLKSLQREMKGFHGARRTALQYEFYRHSRIVFENVNNLCYHVQPLYLYLSRNFGGVRMESLLDLEVVLGGWDAGWMEEAYFNKIILTIRDKIMNRLQLDRLLDFRT
jgi:hypothetical protein